MEPTVKVALASPLQRGLFAHFFKQRASMVKREWITENSLSALKSLTGGSWPTWEVEFHRTVVVTSRTRGDEPLALRDTRDANDALTRRDNNRAAMCQNGVFVVGEVQLGTNTNYEVADAPVHCSTEDSANGLKSKPKPCG